MPTRNVIAELREVVTSTRLYDDLTAIAPYESDALTAFRARPLCVVLPETAAEVVRILEICHAAEVPFVARGSGTSLSGGSLPVPGGVVIGLNRLNRILRIDPEARLAVVEPGAINLAISQAAEPYGLYYAPDPSSQSVCTIGGNVAFNSGGAHCLRHGMTSNHVLALTVALPDGTIAELGDASREVSGPDYVGLFVGSEGLFGVALEITVRLLPKPEAYETVLASYASLEAAGDAVARVVASGLLPGAMEIMDRLAIEAAEAAVGAGYPREAAAVLIVELEGLRESVAAESARLRETIAATGATEVRVADSSEERMAIWRGRKSAFSAVGRLSPDYIVQDGVVPRGRLGEALAAIERMSESAGIRVANVFHAGDGNLHPLILYDGREAGALARAEALAGDILRLCVELGGSITGEHGVGVEKREYLPDMFSPIDIALMKDVRRAIDPLELSNPGKMFPGGDAPSLGASAPHPLERAGVISRE